jgi:hypothetical protein
MPSPTITEQTPRTRRRAVLAVAMAALAAGLLTGCFANPVEDLVQNGVEGAIEGAIEDATGGDVSLGGELPTGFPAEIALVDGTITVGAGTGDGNGWVVVVQTDEADPVAAARARLEDAGFADDTSLTPEQLDTLTGGQLDAAVLANEQYRVLLAVQDGMVTYTVTPK